MIFRPTLKLCQKIDVRELGPLALEINPIADWSAALFSMGRVQYILLSNTPSMYSTVMYGRGITDSNDFIKRSFVALRDLMADDGLLAVYERHIAEHRGPIRMGKSLNRSVTGSQNQLVDYAKYLLAKGEDVAPSRLHREFSDFLLSAAAKSKAEGYGKPLDAFLRLVKAVEAPPVVGANYSWN